MTFRRPSFTHYFFLLYRRTAAGIKMTAITPAIATVEFPSEGKESVANSRLPATFSDRKSVV